MDILNINRNNKGFTLIELLVAIAMFGVITALIVDSYSRQQTTQTTQTQAVQMQQSIRAALMIMTAEIRMAGYDPDMVTSAGIVNAGDGSLGNPFSFTFYAIINQAN